MIHPALQVPPVLEFALKPCQYSSPTIGRICLIPTFLITRPQICNGIHEVGKAAMIVARDLAAQTKVNVVGAWMRPQWLPEVADLRRIEGFHCRVVEHPGFQKQVPE